MNIPLGLLYIPDYITQDQHNYIYENLNNLSDDQWSKSIQRRTLHYGAEYIYAKRQLNYSAPPVTQCESLYWLLNKVKSDFIPGGNQIIVNHYTPKQGIAGHIDHPKFFGPIICSVSLGECRTMSFTHNNDTFNLILEPRSALVLSDDARYIYKHAIKPEPEANGNRISITIRSLI